jgi:hypothetical protein
MCLIRCVPSLNPLTRSIPSSRTVTLVSNRSVVYRNDRVNISIDGIRSNNADQHDEEPPMTKRMKLDSTRASLDRMTNNEQEVKCQARSIVTMPTYTTDDHIHRRERDVRRQQEQRIRNDVTRNDRSSRLLSRSRSKDNNDDHTDEDYRRHSRASPSSSLTSSTKTSRKRKTNEQRSTNDCQSLSLHSRKRYSSTVDSRSDRCHSSEFDGRYRSSYDKYSLDHDPKKIHRPTSSSSDRSHGIDESNSSSNGKSTSQPIRHKIINYHHQSVADRVRSIDYNVNDLSASTIDFNCSRSSSVNQNMSTMKFEDLK